MTVQRLWCWCCGGRLPDKVDCPDGQHEYGCCGVCHWHLWRVRQACLPDRAAVLVLRLEASLISPQGGRCYRAELLRYKRDRIKRQLVSGMIAARCRCSACAKEKPASISRGGCAVG